MSSRLNPREYDLGELRDALGESPRGDDDGPGDEPAADPGDAPVDGRPDDLAAIADLLHEDPGDGTAAGSQSDVERAADERVDEHPPERPASGDESVEPSDERTGDGRGDQSGDGGVDGVDGPSGAAPDRGSSRPAVGRTRRNAARFPRSASRDRTPDGEPRRRNERRDGTRSAASGRDRSTASGNRGRDATASPEPATRVGGFELLAAGSGGDLERPYLARLPDSYRAQLEVLEWLEWLLGTCGLEATVEALAYYESVEWLSGPAREDLEGFLEGLSIAEPPDPRPLGVEDHRVSLRYVARLAHRGDR